MRRPMRAPLHIRSLHDVITFPRWRPLLSSRPLRSFRALYPLRTIRPLDSLHTTPPVHLHHAGIVAASLAVVISRVVGPIKPSKFAAAVGSTILSTIPPPVLLTIVTPI